MDFNLIDLIELIKAIAPIVAAAMSAWALVQTKVTHNAVNSRMDKMLKLAEDKATAEATLAEKAIQAIKDAAIDAIKPVVVAPVELAVKREVRAAPTPSKGEVK